MNVGIDIVKVSRIGKLSKSRRFLDRVFSEDEISYCRNKKNSAQHYAVRFAAKEAVWKALSKTRTLGVRLTHKDIRINNRKDGMPRIILPRKLKGIQKGLSISLSHTREFAVAVAALE
ncbi:MAG: holo-ACP synthase [Elusimicrobiota bacterium]